MNNMTHKSANQLYKESGSTLSFKNWLEREKAKGVEINNVEANEALENMINQADGENAEKNVEANSNKKVLLRNITITVTIIALGALAYKLIYRKKGND